MRTPSKLATALAAASLVAAVGWTSACGSSSNNGSGGDDGGGDSGGYYSSGGGLGDGALAFGGSSGGVYNGPCPSGLLCNVSCSGSFATTVSGKVYDPAGRDPLYNIVVFIPANPLQPLPSGVPTGSDACSCPALYKSGAITATTTAVDGTFTLKNAPVGTNVPLVIQVGKWRRLFHINVNECVDNPLPDKGLTLPSSIAAGDTDDSMPQIAISTGSADSLECLMTRIGLPATEYVAGAGGSGHVHVFAGGGTGSGGSLGGGGPGTAEVPGMAGAPASPTSLWAMQSQLMPYDVVLLSCEGGETYAANPAVLEQYLNAGGRVFASHYHYAWFSGPLTSGQTYVAPSDWGSHLASWTANGSGSSSGGLPSAIGGAMVTTLNGSTTTFVKGQALAQWLGNVGALGQNGVPSGQLSIFQPRYNAQVGPGNKPSQAWITSSPWTMYLSFDAPVNPPTATDGQPAYCGRAVFSDLHVAGDPSTTDGTNPPSGCFTGPLSPQEKALEFMLFDLSACVIPDTVPPDTNGVPQ